MAFAPPLFVVLDGIDGCGKSTQAKRLAEALSMRRGAPALHLREPGSTRLGERIRELLLSRALQIAAPSETLLFAAARRAMLDELVAPALARGVDVVCERFHASTFAYQAFAGGLDAGQVLELLRTWAGEPVPQLTLILDLDPELAQGRRRAPSDRIEDRGLEFQRRVASGYRRYAELEPLAQVVAADGSEEHVHRVVLAAVNAWFAKEAARG